MNLYWYGQTCIKIQEGGITIAIDPYKTPSLSSPRMAADILLLTAAELEPAASAVSGDKFLIASPGEYEVKGVFVDGVASNGASDDQQTFYFLEVGGITIGPLGKIKKGDLSDKQLETFENVDVLLVPVGADAKNAASLVNQIEPKIIVPIYYQLPKLKEKLASLDDLKKQLSVKSETGDKLALKLKENPQDDMKMVILEPQV